MSRSTSESASNSLSQSTSIGAGPSSSGVIDPAPGYGSSSSSGSCGEPLPTLMGSFSKIWAADPVLSALVPPQRVVSGRVPGTEEYPMPYVSILLGHSSRDARTNDTQYNTVTVTFQIWVDDTRLALGEQIEQAITNAFADRGWRYQGGRVIDCLDNGPAIKSQSPAASYKAWEIVQVMTLRTVRRRKRNLFPLRNGSH